MKKDREINSEQLQTILGDDYQRTIKLILPNCFCLCDKKRPITTIVDYRIFINEFNDVVLRGKCVKCGKAMARCLETGENEVYLGRIKKL
jgi:hypothetical protein